MVSTSTNDTTDEIWRKETVFNSLKKRANIIFLSAAFVTGFLWLGSNILAWQSDLNLGGWSFLVNSRTKVILGSFTFIAFTGTLVRSAFAPNPVRMVVDKDLMFQVQLFLARNYPDTLYDLVRHEKEIEHLQKFIEARKDENEARRRQEIDSLTRINSPGTVAFDDDALSTKRARLSEDEAQNLLSSVDAQKRSFFVFATRIAPHEDDNEHPEHDQIDHEIDAQISKLESESAKIFGRYSKTLSIYVNEFAPARSYPVIFSAIGLAVVGWLLLWEVLATGALIAVQFPEPADLSIWNTGLVVIDQLVKGIVVDILEFFELNLIDYKIQYSAWLTSAILLCIRLIPGTVIFRLIGNALQQNALSQIIQSATTTTVGIAAPEPPYIRRERIPT